MNLTKLSGLAWAMLMLPISTNAFMTPSYSLQKTAPSLQGKQLHSVASSDRNQDEPEQLSNYNTSRRKMFQSISVFVAGSMGLMNHQEAAWAAQPRNEALCKTGFFTNIAQRMCTDIGDITEDGLSKDLTKSELGVTEGLLGKLNLDLGNTDVKETENANNSEKDEVAKDGDKQK